MKKYDFANVTARPFPSIYDVANPYIFGGIKSVINVSEREDMRLLDYYKANSITYNHLPIKECVPDMGWSNILKCVEIIVDNIRNDIPTIVHCIGGNNRSPLVVECAFYALYGYHLIDEYKGAKNHLQYNVEQGYLPLILQEIEIKLSSLVTIQLGNKTIHKSKTQTIKNGNKKVSFAFTACNCSMRRVHIM